MTNKVQAIPLTAEGVLARRAKIDQYGEVTRRLALAEPDGALEAALKEEIQGWHKDGAGDQPASERGFVYEIQLSARQNKRTIVDRRKAFNILKRRLGIDGLIAALEIPLGILDKSVSKSEQEAFVTEEHSGHRTLKVVALHAAVTTKAV